MTKSLLIATAITGLRHKMRKIMELFFSDGHDTGIYSWDLLYDFGLRQDEMWSAYLKRLEEAGASREPQPGFEARPKTK